MSKKPRLPYNTIKPDDVDGQWTLRTEYYKRELFRFVKGIFKVECPKTWNKTYLLNVLCTTGYLLLVETSDAGILPFYGTVTGVNYMNFPTGCLVANSVYENLSGTFGVDAEIVYLDRDDLGRYFNFWEMINIFSEKLASADAGIDVNILNSKLAFIAEAESRGEADTIKTMFKKISQGSPLVVHRKDILNPTNSLNMFFNNLKQNYIANDLQDTKRRIYNEFLSKLGINNSNTDKKERLITSEVDSNTEELENNINAWKDNIKLCVDNIHRTFPDLEFNIELRYGKKKERNADDSGKLNTTMDMEASK